MTYDELRARIAGFLFDQWLPAAGLSEQMLRGFLQHGIPEEWAKVIADVIHSVPVSAWPKLIHAPRLLHKRERFGSVSDVTRKHHGLAIAKAAAGKDPFRLHITQRGMSQNKVAKKAGCSDAALSRYRKGRPIPTTIANRIQAATDWPADAEHWPGGLV